MNKKHPTNPLWIISLFIGLTEISMGYAASQTSGQIQIAFTLFAIGFPILIAILFFLFLWYKPQAFYAPKDFGESIQIADYVKAMSNKIDIDYNIYNSGYNSLHDRIELLMEKMGPVEKYLATKDMTINEKEKDVILNAAVLNKKMEQSAAFKKFKEAIVDFATNGEPSATRSSATNRLAVGT